MENDFLSMKKNHFKKEFPVLLQSQIEKDIVAGHLEKGRVYTLSEICERYNVSRYVLTRVIGSQIRKGLVLRENRNAVRIIGFSNTGIISVFQYAEKSGLKPRTIVRSLEVIPADRKTADVLLVPQFSKVFVQIRTRLVEDEVLANQYNFIPYEVCPNLADIDLSHRSFQTTLEEDFHTVITHITETCKLSKPSRDDKAVLGLQAGEAVLVLQRISFSKNNLPLVFADIHIHPGKFHYVKDLWPQAAHLIENYSEQQY